MANSNPTAERGWAMACHLAGLAGFVGFPLGNVLGPLPLGNVIGPLIIWLLKKDEFRVVDTCGKEALNFQISMTIYMALAAIFIRTMIGGILLIGLMAVDLVLMIRAAIKTNNGEDFQYPLTIHFIK